MDSKEKQDIYIQERWQKQRDYYSKRSAWNKRWYQRLQVFMAAGAIAVPIILSIPEIPKPIPIILSGLVAISAAMENLFRFGDNWRNFRLTLEALKREKVLFDIGAGPYQEQENAFPTFVERVEALLSEEVKGYFPDDAEQSGSGAKSPELPT